MDTDDKLYQEQLEKADKLYEGVKKQLDSGEYLANGFVSYTTKIPFMGDVTVRTLLRREQNYINSQGTVASKASSEGETLTLMFAVERVTGNDVSILSEIRPAKSTEEIRRILLDSKRAQSKLELINNWPETVAEAVLVAIDEVRSYVRVKIADTLKNQTTL